MPFDGHGFVEAGALQRMGQKAEVTPAPMLRRVGRELRFAAMRCFGFCVRSRAPGRCEPTTIELLRMARALIEEESQWTRRFYETRDRRYCAVGALRAAARGRRCYRTFETAERLLHGVARQHGYRDMEQMNDSSTHDVVLAAFDAAIADA